MDQTDRFLEEIRDILRRTAEDAATERAEIKRWRAESDARVTASIETQRAYIKLYRRALVAGAVIVVLLLLFLFNVATR